MVERGKRAYQKIKADAATMRENWRAVGEALLVGKVKENRNPGQKFSEWREENFPGLHETDASDAIWFSENFNMTLEIAPTVTHPRNIRAAYNDAQSQALLEGTEVDSLTTTPTIELDTRSAEKVVKLVRRAEAGDEGSAMAKRHVEAPSVNAENFLQCIKIPSARGILGRPPNFWSGSKSRGTPNNF